MEKIRISFIVLLMSLCAGLAQAQLADFEGVDFSKADSVAELYRGRKLNQLPVLAHQLTAPLPSKVEQFRAIYTWVSTNLEYDYHFYRQNQQKRKKLQNQPQALADWSSTFQKKSIQLLIKEQRTVCTGYAYVLKELANLADIKCEIVDGYGRTASTGPGEPTYPNHSWNAVALNGKWYLCDPTWSSGSFDHSSYRFVPEYKDGYFLADPSLFVKNHYPLATKWLLLNNPPTLDEFRNTPIVYDNAFQYNIVPVAPKQMQLNLMKHDSITFLLDAPQTVQLDKISLFFNTLEVQAAITRREDGLIEIKRLMNQTGLIDVHVKIDGEYVTTYVARVKRKK